MITEEQILAAARELIDRHGADAVEVARERTARHEQASDWPAHTLALRVLNEVEKLCLERLSD